MKQAEDVTWYQGIMSPQNLFKKGAPQTLICAGGHWASYLNKASDSANIGLSWDY